MVKAIHNIMPIKEEFREIYDEQNEVDNMNLFIKLIRVLIRYTVKFFGLRLAIQLLKLFTIFLKINFRLKTIKYGKYLLRLNILRLQYFDKLSKKDLKGSIDVKYKMANLILNESYDRKIIENAKQYKKYLSSSIHQVDYSNNKQQNKKNFYIYGPNSENKPNEKYIDYTIILLKPYPNNLINFKKKYLFINAFYYQNFVSRNKDISNELIKNYDKCLVGANLSNLDNGYESIDLFSQGYFGSLMALGRILFYLNSKYQSYNCVIEGFDFYLNKDPYKNLHYHKLERDINNQISEFVYCLSLAEHDFLYNFMGTKELLNKVNIIDSDKFKKIIKLSRKEYAEKLFENRDFRSLKFLR